VRNEKDKIIKVQGSFQDITEDKLAEKTLRLREEMMRNSQSVAHICSYSTDLNVTEINKSSWVCSPEFYKIFGIDETYPHTIDGWANFIHPDYRKKVYDYHESVVKEKKTFSREYKIIRINDGAERWVHGTGKLEFDEKGNPVRMHGAIQDITERKNTEEHLRQAQKMESVGSLAGGVAHDFNNMLSIILGNAEIIREDIDSANPFAANLEEIYKAAKRSANLTRQLLAFARKQTIAPKILNLNHVIDDMLKMLKRLIGEDIDLTWQPAQNLEPVKIDPSQIDQILTNLCVNARGAIKSGGKVTIETDNISFDAAYCKEHAGFNPGNYVMMAVSDDGAGMDKKTLDNLFEPFFTTKDIGQGTGLGLATVYGIVKQNNGFINVYSEPGEGTTFKIYLPVHSEPAVSKQKDFKETSQKGNETILLVEDEEAILMMTKMMLGRLGYTVLTASGPNEAISIVEASDINAIHLLMTDVVMPEMNGRDLSKKLLSMYPDLKCLYMSGYTANVIAHHGVLDTGVQFINKPFSRQDLATKVREVLDEANGEKF
jgi:PAS domain S-box-containing protein